ncbi:MAG: PilZ domain-containing protein [Spirochaetaceae bacterium]
MAEKRGSKRFMIISKVECFKTSGETINLSRKGMQIKYETELPINTPISFFVFLPNSGMLTVNGRILWYNEHSVCGIKFENNPLKVRLWWNFYILKLWFGY